MKIVVDTSVWIEFLRGKQPYHSRLRGILERGDVVAFEPVFGELLQGARGAREIELIQRLYENLPKKEQTGIFVSGGVLSSQKQFFSKGVGIIDAAIAAFAFEHKLKVWTLDKKLLTILPKQNIF